jgi:glycosyltransferase involved in cell wall biosynthesis
MLLHKSVEHDSRVRREARALAEDGHEVTVLHLPREPGELDGPLDGFHVRSVTPPAWVRRRLPFALYRVVFFAAFVRAVRRLRPDIVHAHDAAMLAPGWAGARLTGAKLVYDSHEYAAGVPYRERAWALFVNGLERLFVSRCAAVITVSDGIAERLRERYGLRKTPVVVRNVPDPAAYGCSGAPPDLRAEFSIPVDSPLALHLGAVARDRGCESLVRALHGVPDCHLLFLGADDGAYVQRLCDLARGEGVADRVHFRGSVPIGQVIGCVSQATVGLSLLEATCENHRLALPNKAFEYLAAGVPVVLSDLPESRRTFGDVPGVCLVDVADPGAVAAAIRRAVKSGRADIDALTDRFNWPADAARLLVLYEALVGERV